MRVLDLFCGGGGAAMGYYRAFGPDCEIVGIDNRPMPRYPFAFVLADALEYCAEHGREFDFIHASPPCQVHSVLAHLARPTHKDFVPATRHVLEEIGKVYVIENVPGPPLKTPLLLCGSMFGLSTIDGHQLRRHRLFEFSTGLLMSPSSCNHAAKTIGIFGSKARDTGEEKCHYSKPKETRGKPSDTILLTLEDAQSAMGIDWMTQAEMSQAIPPAYTEWIGRQLLAMGAL